MRESTPLRPQGREDVAPALDFVEINQRHVWKGSATELCKNGGADVNRREARILDCLGNYIQDDSEDRFSPSYLRKQVSILWMPACAGMTIGWDLQVCHSPFFVADA